MLLVGLSALVGLWLRPATYHSPYLFFYAAILISLLYGGFGTGLASTFLSALLVNLLFQQPYGQFSHDLPDLARGSYFCLSFGFICWLVDTKRKAAEGQIQTQRQLLDMAAAPVIMCDEDDQITYWNKGAEAVYGWNEHEAMGQHITELLHSVLPEPIQNIKTQLASVGQWSGELKRTRKDGSAAFVSSSWTLRSTGRHGLTRLESDHDLTEQRKAEELLRGSEYQFRTMANAMPQLAWMANPDGWTFWYNQGWYVYTGTTPQQMEGWGWQSVHDPAELPKVMERWQASIATSEPFEMVFPLRSAHGEFRAFLTRISPIKDASGKVLRWFGTNTDISAQMQIEADLRRSKERLDLALEVADMGEWELDLRNHTASRSLHHDQIFGYTSLLPEWTYEMFLKHVLPEDRAGVDDKFKTSLATGTWDFEARIQRVDREVRWIWARGRVWTDESGQAARMFGIVTDITDRKRAQEELRESEDRYRDLVENSQDLICTHDLEGKLLSANQASARLLGYEVAGLLNIPMREIIAPEFREQFNQYLLRLKNHGGDKGLMAVLAQTGERRIWEYDNTLRTEGVPAPIVRGMAHDVTERVLAEKALRLSEARLRLAVRVAAMGIWELQFSTRTLIWAPEVRDIFGVPPDTPQPSFEEAVRFTHAEDRALVGEQIELLFAGKQIQFDYRIIRPDGRVRWIEVNGKADFDNAGRPIRGFGMIRDVTERHRLEEEFLQAQKMEAVGRLSGGVAHDFNNILMVITGYGDLLKAQFESDERLRPMIEAILEAANRAASLTHQMLAFSRKQVLAAKVLDLNSILADLGKMLPRLIGEDIDLEIVPGSGLGRVMADAVQIQQVVMNLVVNARDAMPEGGRLTIETANAKWDEKPGREYGMESKPGSFVSLSVADTGIGMDRETRAHLFEPFFTTKDVDKGTGLGLSIVYGVVKQSGGFIWVDSEPGQGTTFKIYLPRIDAEETSTSAINVPPNSRRGSETILLVEDEQGVREAISQFLQDQGYTVLEAHNPSIAIEIAQEQSKRIHLLITDMIMPEMNGSELAKQLTATRPDMGVLYISGYTDRGIAVGTTMDSNMNFLQKPFGFDVLGRKLRDILGPPN